MAQGVELHNYWVVCIQSMNWGLLHPVLPDGRKWHSGMAQHNRSVCLHYIFLSRIRIHNQLNLLVEAWNNHSVGTEGHWTPQQIWVNIVILEDICNTGNTAIR